MADPDIPGSRAKWFWLLAIVLLAVLTLVWLFNPSGNEDEPGVEDPITTGDLTEPVPAGADTVDQPIVPGAPPAEEGTSTLPAEPPLETEPTPMDTPQ